jgi:predicted MFS family arabinose efflux permease
VSWRLPLSWRLLGLQVGSAACLGCVSVAAAEPVALGLLMLFLGAVAGPSAVTVSALLDGVAGEGALTRAYSLVVAAALIGSSLGYALGGSLVAGLGTRAAFIAAAIVMALVAVWTLRGRRTLAA